MSIEVKQRAHALIDALPDSASWQDVLYALETEADIEDGLDDARADRVLDSAQVRRTFRGPE